MFRTRAGCSLQGVCRAGSTSRRDRTRVRARTGRQRVRWFGDHDHGAPDDGSDRFWLDGGLGLHARPAAPLARWEDGSGILAGRDLEAGGTWLGVAEAGRFALVTNYRDEFNEQISAGGVDALIKSLTAKNQGGK